MSVGGAATPFTIPRPRARLAPGAFVCAALVAGVLVTAAIGKATSTKLAGPDLALVIGEALVALAALVFHNRRLLWVGVALLFGAFAGYSGQRLYSGHDCGCFGDSAWAKTFFQPRVTLAIDLFAVAMALALAGSARLRGVVAPFSVLLSSVAAAAGVGLSYAALHSPEAYKAPDHVVKTTTTGSAGPVATLMALPMMEDIRSATLRDPAWLVYIYNPECHICQEHLPAFNDYMDRHAADAVMRVRVVSMADAESQHEIPMWAWEQVPTTVLFRAGAEITSFGRENVPDPETVRSGLVESPGGDGAPGADAVGRLLASPDMADIATARGGPAWLVYVYNPECAECLTHLGVFKAFQQQAPKDADLQVRILSMQDLRRRMGLEVHDWPGIPTTLLMRNGRIERTYVNQDVPDPFEVWAGLGAK